MTQYLLLSAFILQACFSGSSSRKAHELSQKIKEAYRNARKASALYVPRKVNGKGEFVRTAPPAWATNFIKEDRYQSFAGKTTFFYDASHDLEKVKRLFTNREPVNIEMERVYFESEWENTFGYKHGAYAESTENELMPNIAVYTHTPIRDEDGNEKAIHVISLIGAGFDHPDQPDFKYFLPGRKNHDVKDKNGNSVTQTHLAPGKESELKARIEMNYRFAFEKAKRSGLKFIQYSGVGDGNFAECSKPPKKRVQDEDIPPVHLKWKIQELNKTAVKKLESEYPEITVLHGWNNKGYFDVPSAFWAEEPKPDFENTLFINAWDPFSLVGNGHAGDESLDGKYGQMSAMAWLSWPFTNPFITEESYVAVEHAA